MDVHPLHFAARFACKTGTAAHLIFPRKQPSGSGDTVVESFWKFSRASRLSNIVRIRWEGVAPLDLSRHRYRKRLELLLRDRGTNTDVWTVSKAVLRNSAKEKKILAMLIYLNGVLPR